jgi:hypothetical protein
MVRTIIRRAEARITEFLLDSGDALDIRGAGALLRADTDPSNPVVRIATGAGAVAIENRGRIAVDGGNGAAIQGDLAGDLGVRIVNHASGSIQGGLSALRLRSAEDSTGFVRLANAGTIDGGFGSAIDFGLLRAEVVKIANRAGATLTNDGSRDVVSTVSSGAVVIENAGVIRVGDRTDISEDGNGVDLGFGGGISVIINEAGGVIEGGKHGVAGDDAARIVNAGSIIGRNGSGLDFESRAVVVRNGGLISGRWDGNRAGEGGEGHGISADYIDLRNSGRIEGLGIDGSNDADGVAARGGRIRNEVGGVIFSDGDGILIDDGDGGDAFFATEVRNEGTIVAVNGYGVRFIGDGSDQLVNFGDIRTGGPTAVDTGDGDDLVTNGGSIVGDVLLGGGADRYRASARSGEVSGVIDGGSGEDRFFGNAADETFIGGKGADQFTGSSGRDMYVYREVQDSRTVLRDLIWDLDGDDVIDLAMIDADQTAEGDQAFRIVAADGLPPAGSIAGSLTSSQVTIGGETYTSISGYVTDDLIADFEILLSGVHSLEDLNLVL